MKDFKHREEESLLNNSKYYLWCRQPEDDVSKTFIALASFKNNLQLRVWPKKPQAVMEKIGTYPITAAFGPVDFATLVMDIREVISAGPAGGAMREMVCSTTRNGKQVTVHVRVYFDKEELLCMELYDADRKLSYVSPWEHNPWVTWRKNGVDRTRTDNSIRAAISWLTSIQAALPIGIASTHVPEAILAQQRLEYKKSFKHNYTKEETGNGADYSDNF